MNKRKRKLLLVLPVLVIPFLTLAFWAMGGGRRSDTYASNQHGLNLRLPDAYIKKENVLDKLGFYAKADRDSMKMREWMRSDPYYRKEFTEIISDEPDTTNPEEKLMERINDLQKKLSTPYNDEPVVRNEDPERITWNPPKEVIHEIPGEDPEMKQLEVALDKILDIQHPERVREKMKEASAANNKDILLVSTQLSTDTLAAGFYGIRNEVIKENKNAIGAVVHESQELVNGSIIKLRLVQDVFINNVCIPKGNFVHGTVSLIGERLNIEIQSIRTGNALYNVKLDVYDMDGLAGIYIPGAITREVAKQSADNSLQLMDINTVDPSLKAQATVAGIGAAKNLFNRKVKLVKIYLKAGYKLLLKSKL